MTEEVAFDFTVDEKIDLGRRLAHAIQKVNTLEREKTTGLAALNSSIKDAQAEVADLSQKVAQGYEMRPTEVIVVFDTPRPGMKHILIAATSKFLREEEMTPEERQGQLFDEQ